MGPKSCQNSKKPQPKCCLCGPHTCFYLPVQPTANACAGENKEALRSLAHCDWSRFGFKLKGAKLIIYMDIEASQPIKRKSSKPARESNKSNKSNRRNKKDKLTVVEEEIEEGVLMEKFKPRKSKQPPQVANPIRPLVVPIHQLDPSAAEAVKMMNLDRDIAVLAKDNSTELPNPQYRLQTDGDTPELYELRLRGAYPSAYTMEDRQKG